MAESNQDTEKLTLWQRVLRAGMSLRSGSSANKAPASTEQDEAGQPIAEPEPSSSTLMQRLELVQKHKPKIAASVKQYMEPVNKIIESLDDDLSRKTAQEISDDIEWNLHTAYTPSAQASIYLFDDTIKEARQNANETNDLNEDDAEKLEGIKVEMQKALNKFETEDEKALSAAGIIRDYQRYSEDIDATINKKTAVLSDKTAAISKNISDALTSAKDIQNDEIREPVVNYVKEFERLASEGNYDAAL